MDETDKDLLHTALREAHEEVALPLDMPSIHPICTLEPFISAYGLLVTPIIAFLSDLTVLESLKAHEGEVSRIFSHPLEAMLDPTIMRHDPALVPQGSEDWHYEEELHNYTDHPVEVVKNSIYRNHRFRSIASPVKGLTADILIKTAEIAFEATPQYERYAPGQVYGYQAISKIAFDDDATHAVSSVP